MEDVEQIAFDANGFTLHIFDDIDLTLLYDWLPSDIQTVVTVCLTFLVFLAGFHILHKILDTIK